MNALSMRLQAQALKIEARAKERLADEIDAVDDSRPKGRPKSVPDENAFTASNIGLSRKEIHEARQIRNAESADPGAIERAVDLRLASGLPPTRAAKSCTWKPRFCMAARLAPALLPSERNPAAASRDRRCPNWATCPPVLFSPPSSTASCRLADCTPRSNAAASSASTARRAPISLP